MFSSTPDFVWIEDLLNDNHPPSDQEAQKIRNLLVEPQKVLQDLDGEILLLKSRLTDLERKRNETKKQIFRYHRILSPIRRLPADALREIFYHCLPIKRNPIMKLDDCPMLLTRVCSLWRTVAKLSPRLWERLYITFSDDDAVPDIETAAYMVQYGEITAPNWRNALSISEKERRTDLLRRRYEGLEEWLSRSGTRPLALSILFTSPDWYPSSDSEEPEPPSIAVQLFSLLAKLSPRIKDLELIISDKILQSLEQVVRVSEMTSLMSLRIDVAYASIFLANSEPRPIPSFLRAPALRKLSIGDSRVGWSIRDPSLISQWGSLTTLSCFNPLTIDQTIFLLSHSSNLVHYKGTISELSEDPQVVSYTTHISLPFLRTLSITELAISFQRIGNFYDRIHAPSLKSVDYYSDSVCSLYAEFNRAPTIPILPLLSKLLNLKRLAIYSSNFEMWAIDHLLQDVPTITHLIIGRTEMREHLLSDYNDDGFLETYPLSTFEKLVVHSNGSKNKFETASLPHLTSLIFTSTTIRLSDDILQNIIKSRMVPTSHTAALEYVKIRFHRQRTRSIEKALVRYAKSLGVKIKLDFEYPPRTKETDPISAEFGVDKITGRTWPHVDAGDDIGDASF